MCKVALAGAGESPGFHKNLFRVFDASFAAWNRSRAGRECWPFQCDREEPRFTSQNLISLHFSPEDLAAADAALARLEDVFAPLIELSVEERRKLSKMGDKSEAFCRQAIVVLEQNPQIVPASFDLAEASSDVATLDALRPRALLGKAEDSEMALGSDIFQRRAGRLRLRQDGRQGGGAGRAAR